MLSPSLASGVALSFRGWHLRRRWLPNNGIKLTSGGSSWSVARFAAVSVAVASLGAIPASCAACSLSRC